MIDNIIIVHFYQNVLESLVGTVAPAPGKKKGKVSLKKKTSNDFSVEYAKSGRAVCCGCQDKIVKVRLLFKFFQLKT